MRHSIRMLSALLLLSCSCEEKPAELANGDEVKVAEVVKGDELVVEKEGRKANVRLLGVHAFEAVTDDPLLKELSKPSVEHLQSSVVGKKIQLTIGKPAKDAHGRYLAYAAAGGEDLNEVLVTEGMVLVYTEFSFERESAYLAAETAARTAKRGIWASDEPRKLFSGLRKQWNEARKGSVKDPLLEEQ